MNFRELAIMTVGIVVGQGCRSSVTEPGPSAGSQSQQVVAVADASHEPYRIDSMATALEQTAAIVEGQVSNMYYTFDETKGPRTNVVLSGVRSRLGVSTPSTITLRIFGGPTGDGYLLLPSEVPTFAVGLRYLVFLSNRDWFLSPVVLDLALRVETVGAQELLIAQDGSTVHGFSDAGVLTGQVRVAAHAGSELSNPFAAPPFTAPDSVELAKTVESASFTTTLGQYRPAGMKSTAMTGSFADMPIAPATGWRQFGASKAAAAVATDAGAAKGGK